MCCLFTILLFLGPRFAIVVWWLAQPVRWSATFHSFLVPALGFLFLPWTTLTYALVGSHGISGIGWLYIGIALLVDLGAYVGGGYGNRRRVPGYAS